MAEQLTLTTPGAPVPALIGYRLFRFAVLRGYKQEEATVEITLLGNDGKLFSHAYYGTKAFNMIFAFNTMNLSVKSLERRILEQLIADNVIKGSVVGAPNPTPDPKPWP